MLPFGTVRDAGFSGTEPSVGITKRGQPTPPPGGQARDGETGDEAMMDRMETRLGGPHPTEGKLDELARAKSPSCSVVV